MHDLESVLKAFVLIRAVPIHNKLVTRMAHGTCSKILILRKSLLKTFGKNLNSIIAKPKTLRMAMKYREIEIRHSLPKHLKLVSI